ncbi:hypothetical protein F3I16_15895 [Pseudomonas sp. L-22-4S-12]|uniref:hypothetical protein n=1 Tax=Pseudomonas sp. L-22-4S-12 TaxID=2610893 RepID=UPI00132429FA|nr:hypothetical protein [Pseudomonas sp. L-22-4S-12]MWV17524.1 hypothetical protein [Pseudomonas sp. L-22-4S-12]
MLEQNLVRHLDQLRAQLAKASEEYLAKGGEIEQLTITDRKPEPKGNLRQRATSATRVHPGSRRELQERDQELAKRAKALANSGISGERLRRKLGLGPVGFEQFVARHGIAPRPLKSKG